MLKLTLRPVLYGLTLGLLSAAMLAGQTTPAAADDATVAMPSGTWSFAPRTVTVNVGNTVTWVNNDNDLHVVTGEGWGSPDLDLNQAYSYTFNAPGTYAYSCPYHEGMVGTVVVIE